MRALMLVLVVACGSGKGTPPAPDAAAPEPRGRVTGSSCEASGDFAQPTVTAALEAEMPAWRACAEKVVAMRDPQTGGRVSLGSFGFSFDVKDGERSVHRYTAGDGLSCIVPIVERLEKTPAFTARNGRVSCEVRFDDSTR
jgi:hypothetical protein